MILIVITIVLIIPIALGILFYIVMKHLGYPKFAKIGTFFFALILLTLVLYVVYEDDFFTKNDAKELLSEHDFVITDQFELIKNESSAAIGDYNHTFKLKISDHDKQRLIQKIKDAENYSPNSSFLEDLHYQSGIDMDSLLIRTQNYQSPKCYVYEYIEASREIGYRYTIISINKTNNELIFEEIHE